MKDCEKYIELLDGYVDNTLTAELRAEVERHLEQCSECRHEVEHLRMITQALHDLPVPETPVELREHVLKSISASEENHLVARFKSLFSFHNVRFAGEVAAIFLCLYIGWQIFIAPTHEFDRARQQPRIGVIDEESRARILKPAQEDTRFVVTPEPSASPSFDRTLQESSTPKTPAIVSREVKEPHAEVDLLGSKSPVSSMAQPEQPLGQLDALQSKDSKDSTAAPAYPSISRRAPVPGKDRKEISTSELGLSGIEQMTLRVQPSKKISFQKREITDNEIGEGIHKDTSALEIKTIMQESGCKFLSDKSTDKGTAQELYFACPISNFEPALTNLRKNNYECVITGTTPSHLTTDTLLLQIVPE